MKKIAVLALLGLVHAAPAFAQRDMYEADRRYCASGRSGYDFNTCMYRLQNDRRRYVPPPPRYERAPYAEGWRREPPPPPPPAYGWQPEPAQRPRLSDMQERALANCAMLAPRDQPRCRATVMSTVR